MGRHLLLLTKSTRGNRGTVPPPETTRRNWPRNPGLEPETDPATQIKLPGENLKLISPALKMPTLRKKSLNPLKRTAHQVTKGWKRGGLTAPEANPENE